MRLIPRLRALFVAALFVGGNFGLPEYDAFAFHRHPLASQAGGAAVSDIGTVPTHAQSCILGQAYSRIGAPPAGQAAPMVRRLPVLVAVSAPTVFPTPVSDRSPSLPRAPPTLSA